VVRHLLDSCHRNWSHFLFDNENVYVFCVLLCNQDLFSKLYSSHSTGIHQSWWIFYYQDSIKRQSCHLFIFIFPPRDTVQQVSFKTFSVFFSKTVTGLWIKDLIIKVSRSGLDYEYKYRYLMYDQVFKIWVNFIHLLFDNFKFNSLKSRCARRNIWAVEAKKEFV
jgi:hypothetical protein